MKQSFRAGLVLAALASPAFGADTPTLETLASRLQQLESELQAARAEIAQLKAQADAAPPPAPTQAPAYAPATSSGNAFNPAISVILDGQFSRHSADEAEEEPWPLKSAKCDNRS